MSYVKKSVPGINLGKIERIHLSLFTILLALFTVVIYPPVIQVLGGSWNFKSGSAMSGIFFSFEQVDL